METHTALYVQKPCDNLLMCPHLTAQVQITYRFTGPAWSHSFTSTSAEHSNGPPYEWMSWQTLYKTGCSLFLPSSVLNLFITVYISLSIPYSPSSLVLLLNLLTGGCAAASLTWKQALLAARPRPLKHSSGRLHQRSRPPLVMQMCSHTRIKNWKDSGLWNIFFLHKRHTHTQYVTQIPTHAT